MRFLVHSANTIQKNFTPSSINCLSKRISKHKERDRSGKNFLQLYNYTYRQKSFVPGSINSIATECLTKSGKFAKKVAAILMCPNSTELPCLGKNCRNSHIRNINKLPFAKDHGKI